MLRGVFFILVLFLGIVPGEHGHLILDEPAQTCAVCIHAHQTPGLAPTQALPVPMRLSEALAPAMPVLEAFVNGRHLFKRAPKVSPPA